MNVTVNGPDTMSGLQTTYTVIKVVGRLGFKTARFCNSDNNFTYLCMYSIAT